MNILLVKLRFLAIAVVGFGNCGANPPLIIIESVGAVGVPAPILKNTYHFV
jgi:hypothetical protein